MSRYKTPLRYPGGKQKLTPFILELIQQNGLLGGHYVEPYAGGAGIAMELLLRNHVSQVHLNDACPAVYAFWRSILIRTDEFCDRIRRAPLTISEWRRQRDIFRFRNQHKQLDVGFSFFYLNRCNRSGIPSAGVIGGISQSGRWKIDARFPRVELIERIEAIALRRSDVVVRNLDAELFIRDYVSVLPRKTLVYCDPPYFCKADRLYLNFYAPEDHVHIAKTIQTRLKRPWIVSYDFAPQILAIYSKRRQFAYDVQYNAATSYKGREILILSDSLAIPEQSSIKSINDALDSSFALNK